MGDEIAQLQRYWVWFLLGCLAIAEYLLWDFGVAPWVHIVVAIGWLGFVLQDAAGLLRRELVALKHRRAGDGR